MLSQYLGYHIPELGAFLCILIVVAGISIASYKLGYHACGKAWKLQVRQNPRIIERSIIDEYELRLAKKDERIKYIEDQYRAVAPALKAAVHLAGWAAKDE
jgi:hypothetical protein